MIPLDYRDLLGELLLGNYYVAGLGDRPVELVDQECNPLSVAESGEECSDSSCQRMRESALILKGLLVFQQQVLYIGVNAVINV